MLLSNMYCKFLVEMKKKKKKKKKNDKLLARLSEGDLVAIEARYHKNCLNSLGNRVRAIKSSGLQ